MIQELYWFNYWTSENFKNWLWNRLLHDKNNFGLAIENIQKHRNIRLVSDDKRRNCLLSKPNYYSTKSFPKLCRNGVSYVKLWKYWKTVTNGKETGFMKDGLRGEIMKEFSRLKPKTYSYIKDNNK